jgi:hypothetical protein
MRQQEIGVKAVPIKRAQDARRLYRLLKLKPSFCRGPDRRA